MLIIGGGIAGTAAAMALHKAGEDVAVYEACASGGADAGAFLTVGANGMLALTQLDAADAVREAGFPLSTMDLRDDKGKPIANVPLRGPHGATPGHHHLRRAALYRVLQQRAIELGIPVVHGKRLTDVHVSDAAVTATFADGSSATGELLIGADGLHSSVRPIMHPTAAGPAYAGQQVCYGYTRTASPPADPATFHMIRGRNGSFGYTVSPEGETWWFARTPGQELHPDQLTASPERWRDRLIEEFRQDRTPAADIVGHTTAELFVDNIYHLPDAPWLAGPMVLIGDAAHAASPASGQGASMALEDAVMLGKALRDLPTHDEAVACYELLRRARVNRVISSGARLTPAKMPNALQRTVRNARSRRQWKPNAEPADRDWLFDYPLDWTIPVDHELARQTDQLQRSD